MKKLGKIAHKRAFVIEQAVLFMFVIFALTFLILNGVLLLSMEVKIDKNALIDKVALEQVGEDFLGFVADNGNCDGFNKQYENYDYQVVDDTSFRLMVWKKTDQNKKLMLYVELSKDSQPSVLKWCYGLPT